MSSYNVKEQIKITEFYSSIEKFIISQKNFRMKNNYKKFRIHMFFPFACFVYPTSFCRLGSLFNKKGSAKPNLKKNPNKIISKTMVFVCVCLQIVSPNYLVSLVKLLIVNMF